MSDQERAVSPAVRAARVYRSEPCARSFREDVGAHLENGYVFSTPEFFGMARPVCRGAEYCEITNPFHVFKPEECDAWWIYLAAGNLKPLLSLFPFPLPFIGWERKNVPRWFGFESALAKLQKIEHPN